MFPALVRKANVPGDTSAPFFLCFFVLPLAAKMMLKHKRRTAVVASVFNFIFVLNNLPELQR